MKIGLITIHKIFNYGSALQTYALQTKINEITGKNSCKIIDYKYPDVIHITDKNDSSLKRFIKIVFFHIKNIIRGIIFFRRNAKFYTFWKKYYSLTEKCTKKNISEITQDFDELISGSDQIWNPRFVHGDTSFFLDFANENQKCISFASAIGQENIPQEQKELFKKQLSKYSKIGIRDTSVRNELINLLNKNVTTVCDPTLLLSDAEWNCLADMSKHKKKSGYILLYILKYSFNPWPKTNELIDSVRKKYKLPVFTVYSDLLQNLIHHYKTINGVSIEDFLCLIRNASFVITTSFHGTCFSLIYKKDFYTIIPDKQKKDSRVYDLLNSVGLENRAVGISRIHNTDICKIDWNDKKICLTDYINDSLLFLKHAVLGD